MIVLKDKHKAELEELNPEEVVLRVLNLSDVLLAEFFLKKLPTDDTEVIAQAAYNQIYGS